MPVAPYLGILSLLVLRAPIEYTIYSFWQIVSNQLLENILEIPLPDVSLAVVPEHSVEEVVGKERLAATADEQECFLVRHSDHSFHMPLQLLSCKRISK